MAKHLWFDTEWQSKMNKSMQVAGMGDSTRELYSRAVRKLVDHYGKSPELLTEDELLDYFIHRQDETGCGHDGTSFNCLINLRSCR